MSEKIILITGATRGIGKAILAALATPEVTVIGTATSQQGAEQISAHIKELGGKGQGLVLNVSC